MEISYFFRFKLERYNFLGKKRKQLCSLNSAFPLILYLWIHITVFTEPKKQCIYDIIYISPFLVSLKQSSYVLSFYFLNKGSFRLLSQPIQCTFVSHFPIEILKCTFISDLFSLPKSGWPWSLGPWSKFYEDWIHKY